MKIEGKRVLITGGSSGIGRVLAHAFLARGDRAKTSLPCNQTASGGNTADWSPEEMMAVGDRATGTTALTNLYEKFSSHAFDGRLADLFERLGVAANPSGSIRFDRGAELATLTRLITLPLNRG